jgi:hypothetical protein
MVIGYDVYKGGQGCIAAMVATTSQCLGNYYTTTLQETDGDLTYGTSLGPAFRGKSDNCPHILIMY